MRLAAYISHKSFILFGFWNECRSELRQIQYRNIPATRVHQKRIRQRLSK